MKCHCELCGGPAAVYRCIDPVVGVVYTCGGCRFPRMKEFRSVQPPQKLVPAVRVDAADVGTAAARDDAGRQNQEARRARRVRSALRSNSGGEQVGAAIEGQREVHHSWLSILDPTVTLAEPKCRQAYQGRFSLRRMGDR